MELTLPRKIFPAILCRAKDNVDELVNKAESFLYNGLGRNREKMNF